MASGTVSRPERLATWCTAHKKTVTGAAAVTAAVTAAALGMIGAAIHFGDLNNNILNSITSHAMEYAIAGGGALLLVVLTSAVICYAKKKKDEKKTATSPPADTGSGQALGQAGGPSGQAGGAPAGGGVGAASPTTGTK